MTQNQSSTQMRHMLPEYVKGRLPEAERQLLDAALNSNVELRAELEWLNKLDREIKATAGTPPPNHRALDRLKARIAADANDMPQSKVVPLRSRHHIVPRNKARWRVGLAIAATVLVVQGLVIGVLMQERATSPNLTPLSGQPSMASGRMLQVTFSPEATEQQIRAALQSVQGQLVGGPGGLGVYHVAVPADFAQPVEKMQKLPGVESVSLAPGR